MSTLIGIAVIVLASMKVDGIESTILILLGAGLICNDLALAWHE